MNEDELLTVHNNSFLNSVTFIKKYIFLNKIKNVLSKITIHRKYTCISWMIITYKTPLLERLMNFEDIFGRISSYSSFLRSNTCTFWYDEKLYLCITPSFNWRPRFKCYYSYWYYRINNWTWMYFLCRYMQYFNAF